MKKYKKKPVVIEAIIFNGDNHKECEEYIGSENYDNTLKYPNIKTIKGVMMVNVGDYIIKDILGEFYPCNPNIFESTYEKVESMDIKISPKDMPMADLIERSKKENRGSQ